MKLTGTFQGRDANGHYYLQDVAGDLSRDHYYINGDHNYIPQYPKGTRISFDARLRRMHGGRMRLTDVENIEVVK